MRAPDEPIHHVATRQRGTFSRPQALDLGATPRLISSRLRSGRWELLAPDVYGLPGHADSWLRRLWISYLTAGPTAHVAFESAGRLQGCSSIPRGVVSLMVDRPRRHANPGAIWHRLDDLAPHHVTELHGFRVTTVDRTVVDLAAVFREGRLSDVVEDLVVSGRATTASIGSLLEQVRRRGKPGVRRLCDVLDQLGPGDGIPHSELERLLDAVIDLSGLPRPVHEHPLPSVRGLVGFVDRYFPAATLIVEADGRKWHERRRNQARDAERDIEAARSGHQTLRMTWEYLTSDPSDAARALVEVHRHRT